MNFAYSPQTPSHPDIQQLNQQQLDCFIEPIKQKLFNSQLDFMDNNRTPSALKHIRKLKEHRTSDNGWKPALGIKKVMEDPKYIFSMERKKARIISGIRDTQSDRKYYEKPIGIMTGTKLKSYSLQTYHKGSESKSMDKNRIFESNKYQSEEVQFKKKKNPNMSFSLHCISNQKKKRGISTEQNFNKTAFPTQQNSTKHINTQKYAREKGSNAVYQYQNLFNTDNIKESNKATSRTEFREMARPATTCSHYRRSYLSSRNNERIKRPQSSALVA